MRRERKIEKGRSRNGAGRKKMVRFTQTPFTLRLHLKYLKYKPLGIGSVLLFSAVSIIVYYNIHRTSIYRAIALQDRIGYNSIRQYSSNL